MGQRGGQITQDVVVRTGILLSDMKSHWNFCFSV